MQYTKLDLKEIHIEQAHGGTGSRQMLIKPEYLSTTNLDAITKGFLPVGNMFDWHNHIDIDEVFIVTQGNGKFYYKEDGLENFFDYAVDDVIIAPANFFHRIVSEGNEETEGFFFRIKADTEVVHSLKFIKRNIMDIPLENIHNATNTRKTLVFPNMIASNHLEAITKEILNPTDRLEKHIHENTDEIGIVLKGEGIWMINNEAVPYETGNILILKGNILYTQIASGTTPTEFFFIRVKV